WARFYKPVPGRRDGQSAGTNGGQYQPHVGWALPTNSSSMAQTKSEIQSLLAGANTHPRHRFGQNFMIDQNLVRLIADAANLAAGDLVIEVGPGTGTLTEELLARGVEVIAVEIDRDLAALLRDRFASEARFRLIEGDA